MFCNYCGTRLPEDALFCKKCGKQQKEVVNTPAPTEMISSPTPQLLSVEALPPPLPTAHSDAQDIREPVKPTLLSQDDVLDPKVFAESVSSLTTEFSIPTSTPPNMLTSSSGNLSNASSEYAPLEPSNPPPPPPNTHYSGRSKPYEQQSPLRSHPNMRYLIVIVVLVVMLISAGVFVGILVEKGNTQGITGNTTNSPNQSGTIPANTNPSTTVVTSTPTPSPTPIPPPFFSDHFDGTSLNNALWTSYSNGGAINVSNSFVTLSTNTNSQSFPYVYSTNNPFPQTGNFSAKVVFQYMSSGPNGDGIVFDTGTPQNGAANRFHSWINPVLILWQDTSSFGMLVAQIGNNNAWSSSGVDTNLHTVLFNYINGEASVSVDGGSFSNQVASGRPTSIWFGNSSQSVASPWSSFNIDQIQVTYSD